MLDLPQKTEPDAIAIPLPRRDVDAKEVLRGYEAYFGDVPSTAKSGPDLTPLELMYAYYDAA
ncbi:hypothetical protein L0V05_02700 [Tabrizicola sp. J26]|uniref:hypothetical protein n=1 Tax=Alitabrizicola rongguiensis TaxID=2909234 RepID=UPI001F159ED6|nr:hypothetical protein [Tabrizicola rongguiensis]MCF1707718.1 hypothetical protein [Tabrizicola rongguiensis]